MPIPKRVCQGLFALLSLVSCSFGGTLHTQHIDHPYNSSSNPAPVLELPSPVLAPRAPPNNFAWTVLCIGDSITAGEGSSDGNGYRLFLRNLLGASGTEVNFVGTQVQGSNNPDNRHEGYGFHRISQILRKVQEGSVLNQQKRANVVLIHAGTNDNNAEVTVDKVFEPYSGTPDRLRTLIDYVLCKDANAVVLVALLVRNDFNQQTTDTLNAAIPGIVSERYQKGYKIRAVDMSMIGGAELKDPLHPNDYGYYHMAKLWHTALLSIPAEWYITGGAAPTKFGGPVEVCAKGKTFFTPAINGDFIAAGAHLPNDPGEPLSNSAVGNTFSPGWIDEGIAAIGTGHPGGVVRFADLDGDGRADYIWVDQERGSVRAWLNPAKDTWKPVNNGDPIAFGLDGTSYVEFADLNNDKRAEYILVTNGQFRVFRNDGPNGNVWLWTELVSAGQQLTKIFGESAGYHYFGDMNGDGLADLAVINANSVIDIWFNTGPSGDGFGWSPCKNKGIHEAQMSLVDIDGDGRADYMMMDQDGGIKGWLNKPGGECGITWVQINGGGPKTVALGAAPAGQVRLADLDGDGKVDYLVVADDGGAVRLYRNIGTNHAPETKPLGGYAAGVRLADINGDGQDDYLSVSDQTSVLAYLNGGPDTGNGWIWTQQANGAPIAFGYAGASRKEIHFADVNGDGLDDYLIVNKDNGAVHCYLNRGPSPNLAWNWDIKGMIALGIGEPGAGVRFADFDGDGRADYIYVGENGGARVWLNAGPGDTLTNWQPLNGGAVSALGVGANTSDVQFADIDGDGKADYLWVHPESGAVDGWYNTLSGTIPNWAPGGRIAAGVGLPGQNIRFGRLGKSGRAEYVALQEDTGAFRVWISGCTEIIGSRAGSGVCQGPPLPPQSSPEPQPSSLPAGSGCVSSPCTPCIGNSCKGCSGSECSGCSGTGCYGCSGNNCDICVGISCTGCRLTDCTTCQGSDCKEGDNSCKGGGCASNFPTTTVDPTGQTVIIASGRSVTIPTGLTQETTITGPGGDVITFTPATSSKATTTVNPSGQTIIISSGQSITIPTGLTQATTITPPGGDAITFSPVTSTTATTTSGIPIGFIIPVRTRVEEPKATDDGSVIPCTVWFFFICIRWGDLEIGGWFFDIPPGIYPPVPPPTITFPSVSSFSWSIEGTLTWPTITVGQDRIPTFSPKPTDGPDKGCKTETAKLCMTTTSLTVTSDSTSTTVMSTCATIFGCQMSNSATEITTGCTTQATSTNWWVSCSTTAPGASSCRTTSSSTTRGCSVTARTVTCGVLTPTASPDPACNADTYPFLVYPKDAKNSAQVNNIQNKLVSFAGDAKKVNSRVNSRVGTIYWQAMMTYNQSLELEQLSEVLGIHDDCGDYCQYDSTTVLNYQDITRIGDHWDFPQLGYLSWPPGQFPNPNPYRYFFDESAGTNIPVYLFDTGATLDNPEFDGLKRRVEWIQLGEGDMASETDSGSGSFHGTSMLSLIGGLRAGVAKKVSPIIVRPPGLEGSKRSVSPRDFLNGLEAIEQHLGEGTTRVQAIVLLAYHFPRTGSDLFTVRKASDNSNGPTSFAESARALLAAIERKGALVVTGSGNIPRPEPWKWFSDGWPSNFAKTGDPDRIESLMVAGGVTSDGQTLYRGKHDYPNGIPQFYAPGDKVSVANGNRAEWLDEDTLEFHYQDSSGTSAASALTAGIAAYLLRLVQLGILKDRDGNFPDSSPKAFKDFLINEALWSRGSVNNPDYNTPDIAPRPGIWNMADINQRACPWNPNAAANKLKRQEEAQSCYTPGTAPGTQQATTATGAAGGADTTATQGGNQPTTTAPPPMPTLGSITSGQPAASLFFGWYPTIDRAGYPVYSSQWGVIDYTVSSEYPSDCNNHVTNTLPAGTQSSEPADQGTFPAATATFPGAIQGHTSCAFTALNPASESGGILRCADTSVRCTPNPSPTRTGCCVSVIGCSGGNWRLYNMAGCFF